MQDAFSNFLHMSSYKCGISTLQLASLCIWIAASAVAPAEPIGFIDRIRSRSIPQDDRSIVPARASFFLFKGETFPCITIWYD